MRHPCDDFLRGGERFRDVILPGVRHGLFPSPLPQKRVNAQRSSDSSVMSTTYRRGAGVESDANLTPRQPFLAKFENLIAAEYEARPADGPPAAGAFLAGTGESGAGPFADSDAFLFGDGGEDGDNGVAKDTG